MKRDCRVVRADYSLYHSFFTTMPHPEKFWESLAGSEVTTKFGANYRFMAAIKYLLLAGIDHPIRELYPDLASEKRVDSNSVAGVFFQDFCECHWAQIISVAMQRDVQINKIGRCALFLPLFAEAYARGGKKPLGLVEVGASAGFGLLWPGLRYKFGLRDEVGPKEASIILRCWVRGADDRQFLSVLPKVERQIGLELNPFDLKVQNDSDWLVALTAPNNLLNIEQVRGAIAMAKHSSNEIRRGCAINNLEAAFSNLPVDSTPIIFHSLTAHHLKEQEKWTSFLELLKGLSEKREFFQATIEWDTFPQDYGKPLPLRLHHWKKGRSDSSLLFGVTDPAADGRWLILR